MVRDITEKGYHMYIKGCHMYIRIEKRCHIYIRVIHTYMVRGITEKRCHVYIRIENRIKV